MAHEAIVSAREVEAGSRKEQSGERGSMGERERDSTRIERTKGRGLSLKVPISRWAWGAPGQGVADTAGSGHKPEGH